MLKFFGVNFKLCKFEYNLKLENMKQLIGFIPTQDKPNHHRVKNLTGDVITIENEIVEVEFSIIKSKKVDTIIVCYPLNECKDYFVSGDGVKRHGLNFREFCTRLQGLFVFKRGIEQNRWELFISNIAISDILGRNSKYTTKDRPMQFNYEFKNN